MEDFLNPYGWVTLGNRSSRTLSIVWDGKTWTLPPFPATVQVPLAVAEKAVAQHPVMGTENPLDANDYEALVYVVGWMTVHGEPMPSNACEQSNAVERFDVSQLDASRQKGREIVTLGRMQPERMTHGLDGLFQGDKL